MALGDGQYMEAEMAGFCTSKRLAIASLSVIAIVGIVHAARATSYTLNVGTGNSATWNTAANWTPNGVPNAIDDVVNLVMPLTTATAPTNGFTLNMATNNFTVGAINIDNTLNPNNYVTRLNGTGGTLTFQSSSGPATFTENAGTPNTTNNGRFIINQPTINLLSDLVVSQDNQPGLNTSTEFATRIDGGAGITITKKGSSNLQLSDNTTSFGAGQGFAGKIDIQAGGIRMIGQEAIVGASGISVQSGGQLQLAESGSTSFNDWNMASGSLTLNGPGKASGSAMFGALRFNMLSSPANRSTNFHPNVVLQTDSRIDVAVAGTTATLSGVVSGSGGLISSSNNATGTLVLSNASNNYTGATQVLSGTLSITHAFLADSNDVSLKTGGTFNLNFAGTDTIRSFLIDGVAQATGIWGAVGSGVAHESALITGAGLLNATGPPIAGVPGDFNNNGIVDAADYVLWRNGGPLQNRVSSGPITQQDFLDWKARFGNTAGAGSALGVSAVPEPATLATLASVIFLVVGASRSRGVFGQR